MPREALPVLIPEASASLLILRRGSAGGVEVLMVRRRDDLAFAPGAWVFPGGRLEDTDYRLARSFRGRASHLRQSGQRAMVSRAHKFAACREAWEETGLRLSGQHWRSAGLTVQPGSRLSLSRLVFFARFVTPPGLARRFDTRFYVTLWRQGHDRLYTPPPSAAAEVSDMAWQCPDHILGSAGQDNSLLLPPTRACLRALSEAGSPAKALLAARRAVPVLLKPEDLAGLREKA